MKKSQKAEQIEIVDDSFVKEEKKIVHSAKIEIEGFAQAQFSYEPEFTISNFCQENVPFFAFKKGDCFRVLKSSEDLRGWKLVLNVTGKKGILLLHRLIILILP